MTQLNLDLLTICDQAITGKDGRLSLINLNRTFMVKKLPTQLPRFALVVALHGEPETTHELNFTLTDPEDSPVLAPKPVTLTLNPLGTSHLITNINHLPVQITGEYHIKLSLEKQPLGQITFNVLKLDAGHDQSEDKN